MSEQNHPMLELEVESDLSVQLEAIEASSNISLTAEVIKFHACRACEIKDKIDELGAEVSQRQDKMRLINEILAEINTLTNDKNSLDISKNASLQEKLRVAKQIGVKLVDDKFKYNAVERDRLIENLNLSADSWDKENKSQMQKIEIYIKELDRIMIMLKEVQKYENQPKRSMIAGIKGG